jgi:hypothetical protein
MRNWILSQIGTGSPFGVAFEEEGGAGGEGGQDGGEGGSGSEGGDGGGSEWFWAEGVPGVGDAPEGYKADKYSTVVAQAQAYPALEGKFGAFTGAPEAYEVKLSEELTEKGVELDAEDPAMAKAMEWAKEAGMSQSGFEGMVNIYAMAQLAQRDATDQHNEQVRADEFKALGQNAQGRIDNLKKWGDANLSEELVKGFLESMPSANAVKAIEHLITMTQAGPLDPNGDPSPGGVTETELKEMQFAKDEHGNRKIHTDKAFKAEYEKKRDMFYGTGEHTQVIG